MIPLSDDNPTHSKPYVTIALIALCCLLFIWQLTLGSNGGKAIFALGVIPTSLLQDTPLPTNLRWVSPELTLLTSMFLHGGFMHLAGNMLYLWIFGDNIEDILGKPVFLVFYFICGIVAALSQALPEPSSQIPMIGASGAISGVLGAYVVFFPKKKIKVAIPFGFFLQILRLPAYVVLIFWFILQLINGANAGSGGGIAFGAHIGGFVAGLVLAPILAVVTRKKTKSQ
ncbi:MAG: rhomboid family intramembrane serine protease [Gammaproteobacteria bacterium]|nr:rhomboid family intramembrane serine protease [Gammaproteobacteria bacterium]